MHAYLFVLLWCLLMPPIASTQNLDGKWITTDGLRLFQFKSSTNQLFITDIGLAKVSQYHYQFRDNKLEVSDGEILAAALEVQFISTSQVKMVNEVLEQTYSLYRITIDEQEAQTMLHKGFIIEDTSDSKAYFTPAFDIIKVVNQQDVRSWSGWATNQNLGVLLIAIGGRNRWIVLSHHEKAYRCLDLVDSTIASLIPPKKTVDLTSKLLGCWTGLINEREIEGQNPLVRKWFYFAADHSGKVIIDDKVHDHNEYSIHWNFHSPISTLEIVDQYGFKTFYLIQKVTSKTAEWIRTDNYEVGVFWQEELERLKNCEGIK